MIFPGKLGLGRLGRLGVMRTDRNNNPIAAAVKAGSTNAYTNALSAAGIPWTYGDAFPSNPSIVTIKILGDPVAGARAILSLSPAIQNWYISHTCTMCSQYGVSNNTQFAALPADQQNAIIAGIYQAEGGSGALMTGGVSSVSASMPPLTSSPADSSIPVDLSTPTDYSAAVNPLADGYGGDGDGGGGLDLAGMDGAGTGLSGAALVLLAMAGVVGVMVYARR
jgi:hypothetical protein